MDTPRARNPLPLAPADAPRRAVLAVGRALRRPNPDPELIVAMVVAALCGDDGNGALELRVTAPGREFPLMTLAIAPQQLGDVLPMVLGCCRDIDRWQVQIRQLGAVQRDAR